MVAHVRFGSSAFPCTVCFDGEEGFLGAGFVVDCSMLTCDEVSRFRGEVEFFVADLSAFTGEDFVEELINFTGLLVPLFVIFACVEYPFCGLARLLFNFVADDVADDVADVAGGIPIKKLSKGCWPSCWRSTEKNSIFVSLAKFTEL